MKQASQTLIGTLPSRLCNKGTALAGPIKCAQPAWGFSPCQASSRHFISHRLSFAARLAPEGSFLLKFGSLVGIGNVRDLLWTALARRQR